MYNDYFFNYIPSKVTITIGMAALFSFVSGPVNKYAGRKSAISVSALLFFLGSAILGGATVRSNFQSLAFLLKLFIIFFQNFSPFHFFEFFDNFF